MKKINRFITLLIFALILTGCAKKSVDMKITDNGKMTVEIIEAEPSSSADYKKEEAEVKKSGFKVEEYKDTEKDLKGIKYSKTYNLKKISGKDKVTIDVNEIGKADFDESQYFQVVKKGLFKTTYKATFIYTAVSANLDSSMEQYTDSFDISYSVTLPRKAITNNADEVSGNTYTWKASYGDKKEITYEFEVKSNTFIYVIVATVLIAAGGVAIFIIKNKNKKTILPIEQPIISQQ